MIISNLWYALSTDIYQLFASRFVVGIAAANYVPANAYLAYATTTEERAKVMSWNNASSVLGFIGGPAFALVTALTKLSWGFKIGNFPVNFNASTYPGYISALLGVLGLFSLIPFKEVPRKKSLNPVLDVQKNAAMRSFQSFTQLRKTSIPIKGVILSLWMQFVLTAAFTLFETIGPLYTGQYLGWDVFYTSLMFLGIAITSFTALMSLQIFLWWFNERHMLIFFNLVLTVGLGIFFEWHNTSVGPIRFGAGVFFASIGYACGAAMLVAIFTKLLDEHEQGVMMGWFSSVASIARMIVPIAASYCFYFFGPNYIFLFLSLLCQLTNIAVIILYPLILPSSELIGQDDEVSNEAIIS